MKNFRKLSDLDVQNKTILLRIDLNVPIIHGKVTDITRIKRVIPTIEYLLARNAKIVLLSHYGRPNGKFTIDMSLSPLTDTLSQILDNKEIKFGVDVLATSVKNDITNLKPGEIILMENLRFHAGEEENDLEFAKHIASLGEVYINDTFSCSHRAHASICALANLLPSGAGLLLQEELDNLKKYLEQPAHPILAIVGGSKVSTKIELLTSLIAKVNTIFIAGAMANTFLHVQECNIGKSKFEKDYLETAKNILKQAKEKGCKIILPTDVVTSKLLNHDVKCKVVKSDKVGNDDMIFDIGPKSLMNLITALEEHKTVIWNGPLGAFEHKPFDIGTVTIAQAISELTSEKKLISIVGGGDVVSAVTNAGLCDNFTYTSTGGGAFLEWIEGKILPGVEVLCK
jgi:phosphoglycerate kinase